MGRLDGKVAIVTGASQGIGRGVALALSKEGAYTVLAARNKENLLRTAEQVKSVGVWGSEHPGKRSPIHAE
jgi:NAD(P)-dependent dehydrogenase (short-subunit alcohol dehydrogenase family)